MPRVSQVTTMMERQRRRGRQQNQGTNPVLLSAGAAALLLYFGGRQPSDVPALVAELRSVLEGDLLDYVDSWAWEGPDTEQLLCLADLIERRVRDDPSFRERVGRTVLSGGEALSALEELADRFGRAGLEHGRRWCDARAADLSTSMLEG
jgi:hypothetical protein